MRFARLLPIIVLLTLTVGVYADQSRYLTHFESANGRFEADLVDEQWIVVEKATKRELYRFPDLYGNRARFCLMTVLIDDDGRSIVVVDDYSDQDSTPDLEVLFFLSEGRVIKTYKLSELMDPRFVLESTSHFRSFDTTKKLTIQNSKLELKTLDLFHYVFDAKSSDLLQKTSDKALDGDAVYVNGTVTEIRPGDYQIIVECSVRGNSTAGTTIQFKADGMRNFSNPESLIIRNGVMLARTHMRFNACRRVGNR